MQFDSFSDFIAMGGYGFYVWLSFGSGLLLICLLIWQSFLQQKNVKKQIAQQLKRQQKLRSRHSGLNSQQNEVRDESTS